MNLQRQPYKGLAYLGAVLVPCALWLLLLAPALGLDSLDAERHWPISSSRPWLKGTFWAVLILIGSVITDKAFTALGRPMHTARGADLVGIIFGAMLLFFPGKLALCEPEATGAGSGPDGEHVSIRLCAGRAMF